jgi:hypothetical protein
MYGGLAIKRKAENEQGVKGRILWRGGACQWQRLILETLAICHVSSRPVLFTFYLLLLLLFLLSQYFSGCCISYAYPKDDTPNSSTAE